MEEALVKLANAALEDWKAMKTYCESQKNDKDSVCHAYIARGREFCLDCPLLWIENINEAVEAMNGAKK